MRQVTLQIPDEVWEIASLNARRTDRPVEEFLASRLARELLSGREASIEPMSSDPWSVIDLSGLTDEQLRLHISARLPQEVQVRLTDLQSRNNEGMLSSAEMEEFDRLLRVVHTGTMLKAHALLAWKRRHGSLPPEFERVS